MYLKIQKHLCLQKLKLRSYDFLQIILKICPVAQILPDVINPQLKAVFEPLMFKKHFFPLNLD